MKRLLIILGMLVFGCNSNNNEPVKIESPTNMKEDENELAEINSTPKEKENEISPKKEFQNGDLIFHTSMSDQSLAIQLASNSKYSHVGIIYQEGADIPMEELIITPDRMFQSDKLVTVLEK